MFKKLNLAKIAIGLPGMAVLLYLGLMAVQSSMQNRLNAAFDTGGKWVVTGAFPLLDAFHVSTIRATDADKNTMIRIRHTLFYGWPFQYCCGMVDTVRLSSAQFNLSFDTPFPTNEKRDETLRLYAMMDAPRIEIPELVVNLKTPLGSFMATGAGVITTDDLDDNSKNLKATLDVDNADGSAHAVIRARLTRDGALNGQIILESANIKNDGDLNGKRIGGILDFEKRVGQDWILSGEGSAGFMTIQGKPLSNVEFYYLDDNIGDKTILLKSHSAQTGAMSDIELKVDKDGKISVTTDLREQPPSE